MSRSRILPSFSSSRQMMMAWKVSGLSHRPAIIASRPASMRLAMAISPSRDSSSTEPISRRYMRTGSSVRSVGSARVSVLARRTSWRSHGAPSSSSSALVGASASWLLAFLGLDDVDAHVGQHRHGVLDLLGGDLLRRQHRVQLVIGDVAARLGGLEQLLDRLIGQVEQRAVALGRRGRSLFGFLGFWVIGLIIPHRSSPGGHQDASATHAALSWGPQIARSPSYLALDIGIRPNNAKPVGDDV